MTGLVHIVDDDDALRKSLNGLLRDAGFHINEHTGAENFLAQQPRYEPSCILLDVKMNGMSGFEMQEQLSKRDFVPPIVFLTGSAAFDQAIDAMRAGACHFLTKPVGDEQLLDAVTEAIDTSKPDAAFFHFLQKLTSAEQAVAKLIRQGLQTKQIADRLNASTRTIEWHRKNIGKKGCIPK